MRSELVHRMRTCAAHILSATDSDGFGRAAQHAADLLLEASDALEQLTGAEGEPLGEPMEILPPRSVPSDPAPPIVKEQWPTDRIAQDLDQQRNYRALKASPPRPRTCPRCDSRAAKRARVVGNKVMLTCPACAAEWPYIADGEWRG